MLYKFEVIRARVALIAPVTDLIGLSGQTLGIPQLHVFFSSTSLHLAIEFCTDRPLSLCSCPLVASLFGDALAMLELTDVQPPSRVDDGGLGRPAVIMVDIGRGHARLPN